MFRQLRIFKDNLLSEPIDGNSQTRPQHHEYGARCPSLGRTGYRIQGGPFAGPTVEAAKQFRQAVKINHHAEIKQSRENASSQIFKSVFGQAARDQRVIVWPDGTVVVGDRIIPGLIAIHGAHTPTGELIGPQQTLRDRKSTRLNSSHSSISYAVSRLKKKKIGERVVQGDSHVAADFAAAALAGILTRPCWSVTTLSSSGSMPMSCCQTAKPATASTLP